MNDVRKEKRGIKNKDKIVMDAYLRITKHPKSTCPKIEANK